MHHRRLSYWLIGTGLMVFLVVGAFFLLPAQTASAQCGSQASSCKNCHETQGQGPVNTDLTTWHGQHAFGDFCYLCHGGNNQVTDKAAAHVGMVHPLEEIAISCKSCHPEDYVARADIYADTLGIKVGSMKATLSATENAPAGSVSGAVATAVQQVPVVAAPVAVVPSAELVDYSQRYDEVVLGKKPLNIGNLILILMIAGILFGGGYFVLSREHLFKLSFQEVKQIEGSYPDDVVDLVPQLAKLKSSARSDLRRILVKPDQAADLFELATKLTSREEKPASSAEEKKEE
jgi:hypothetical protein